MNETETKEKAVLYARFSSERQSDLSISAQRDAIYKYAEANGIIIIKEYVDEATSGRRTDKRDGFNKLIAESATHQYTKVLVHKYDRFCRRLEHMLKYRNILLTNGKQLVSITQPSTGGNMDVVITALQWAYDEFYSLNLGDEVLKGHLENSKECWRNGGTVPYGYSSVPDPKRPKKKKLAINEAEAPAIRLIYDLYLSGFGYDRIAQELNTRGYRTREGNFFTHGSLYYLIRNPCYKGEYVYNLEAKADRVTGHRNSHKCKPPEEVIRIEGGVPAIISADIYDRAMEKMERNRRNRGAYKAKRSYLLSGLIFCGECGAALQANTSINGKGFSSSSYRCDHSSNNCKNPQINQPIIESYVISLLEKYIFDERNIPKLLKGINDAFSQKYNGTAEELKRLDCRIRGLNKRRDNIKMAIMDGFRSEDFREEMMQINADIVSAEEQKQQLSEVSKPPEITEERLREVIKVFSAKIREHDSAECKTFIGDFVDSVIVYTDKVEVNLKIPEGADDFVLRRTVNRKFLPTVKETADSK